MGHAACRSVPSAGQVWHGLMTEQTQTTSATSALPAGLPHHPSVAAQAEKIAASAQLRVAAGITWFAGSMWFVYLHAALFVIWMLVFEQNPWPTLTLIVSLEAIFLSTFVMIGQNRQAAFQQQKADHDFIAQELELKMNTQLTQKIAELTREIHAQVCAEIKANPEA